MGGATQQISKQAGVIRGKMLSNDISNISLQGEVPDQLLDGIQPSSRSPDRHDMVEVGLISCHSEGTDATLSKTSLAVTKT
jgi:hypothetical protein